MTPAAITAMSAGLREHKTTSQSTIRFLGMSTCFPRITNAAQAQAIRDFLTNTLKQLVDLSSLSLGWNNLNSRHAKWIAESLPSRTILNPCYVLLCLNDIGNDGVKALAKVLPRKCIGKLDLESTGFGRQGVEALIEAIKISTPLLPVEVIIRDNHGIPEDKKRELERLVEKNTDLARSYRAFKSEMVSLPLPLFSKTIERFSSKPDLIFDVLRAKPQLFRERRKQRKRQRPDRLKF